MKRKCLVMVSLLSITCSTFQNAEVINPITLYGHDWVLVTMDGQVPVNDTHVTIRLEAKVNDKGSVFGGASCNSYFGTFSIDQNRLKIGPLASTLMACSDPIMQQEQAFLSILEQVTSVEQMGNTLVLTDDAGVKSLMFEAVD